VDPSAARRLTAVARRPLGIWSLIPRRERVIDVEAKTRVRTRFRVHATTTGTRNAKMDVEGELAYHHHHCHHHRCRHYQPHYCCDASYGLQMGPVGARKQKVDSGKANPFLLLRLLGRWWDEMRDAWRGRAPSSAGRVVYVFLGKIGSRVA
jgi:hypothetical protein